MKIVFTEDNKILQVENEDSPISAADYLPLVVRVVSGMQEEHYEPDLFLYERNVEVDVPHKGHALKDEVIFSAPAVEEVAKPEPTKRELKNDADNRAAYTQFLRDDFVTNGGSLDPAAEETFKAVIDTIEFPFRTNKLTRLLAGEPHEDVFPRKVFTPELPKSSLMVLKEVVTLDNGIIEERYEAEDGTKQLRQKAPAYKPKFKKVRESRFDGYKFTKAGLAALPALIAKSDAQQAAKATLIERFGSVEQALVALLK